MLGLGKVLIKAALIASLLWLLFPITMPLSIAFSESEAIAFPPKGFTLKWFYKVFEYESFIEGFKLSTIIASLASLIATLLNIPVSYVLTRYRVPYRKVFERVFDLPVLIPQIVLSFALLIFIVKTLKITSFMALLIGHIIIIYPYTMRTVYAGLSNFNPEIEDAAVSLGASRLRAFFQIVIPNIKESILGAFISSFMISFNAVAISLFLAVGNVFTLPVAMLNFLVMKWDPTISALSFMLVIFTLTLSFLSERLVGMMTGR